MKKENIILEKSYAFALRIVRLYIQLNKQNEYILSKQLLRSGTSIGANSEEGDAALTKKDFIWKFSIALKEAKESHYWLRLLKDSSILKKQQAESLLIECEELIRILTSIVKTSKKAV